MAHKIEIKVKESLKELKAWQRKLGELGRKKILMLIIIKKNEGVYLSKRKLSELTGINHNSILKWKKMYREGGIEKLLEDNRKRGNRREILSAEHKNWIGSVLNDPKNGVRGYVELQKLFKEKFSIDIKYTTLLRYCQRHFGSKIKAARKSHVKKNENLVQDFKKNFLKNVQKSFQRLKKSSSLSIFTLKMKVDLDYSLVMGNP